MKDATSVRKELLLAEVDDLLRHIPPHLSYELKDEEWFSWVGRTAAVIERWSNVKFPTLNVAVELAHRPLDMVATVRGLNTLKSLLYEARADLRMEVGLVSVVVPQGQVFEYFDEIRKVIETARSDVFFVDPYLEADFVSRYLPHVTAGTGVRLLASKNIPALLSAVNVFAKQSGAAIQVRSSNDIHDRYVFVDKKECYLSGASFKDGAKKAPAVFTQIGDAFQAMWDAYDAIWSKAKVERA
jgi:hypothetical protein